MGFGVRHAGGKCLLHLSPFPLSDECSEDQIRNGYKLPSHTSLISTLFYGSISCLAMVKLSLTSGEKKKLTILGFLLPAQHKGCARLTTGVAHLIAHQPTEKKTGFDELNLDQRAGIMGISHGFQPLGVIL